MDPQNADNQLLLGRIQFLQSRWDESLAAAEAALGIDPEHQGALNLRAECAKLGRTGPAESRLRGALAVDAENAQTHANLGWLSLQLGNRQPAIEHFREALRLDPELDSARSGVVESLGLEPGLSPVSEVRFSDAKAGNAGPLDSCPRRLAVLCDCQPGRRGEPAAGAGDLAADGRLSAAGAAHLVGRAAGESGPAIAPLRPLGGVARRERRASNCIGGFMLAALVAGIGYLIHPNFAARDVGLFCGLMILPLAATFSAQWRQARRMMAIYTVLVGLMGLYVIALDLLLFSGPLRGACPVWLGRLLVSLFGPVRLVSCWGPFFHCSPATL